MASFPVPPAPPPELRDWRPITGGESGDLVLRSPDGGRIAKVASPARGDELAGERDRLLWLHGTAIPSPAVLGWGTDVNGAMLLIEALPGVPADELGPVGLERAWPSVLALVRSLHRLPASSCPFVHGIADMLAAARATVAGGRVRTEFLPEELQDAPPVEILESLEVEAPLRLSQEAAQTVVCHGDLCLPNILVDPHTCQVTGLVDAGRLGRGDPYLDLALLLATAREVWADGDAAAHAERLLEQALGLVLDRPRRDFVLRLDPLTW
ncbi:phosphotransferase [Brachybacterium hainanense]|uniref:Phosphotransferase n=1 Tax=Brachybacterium hainanense TaxID=1541174 RepID=A0ABV6RDY9_9MICO